MIDQVLVKAYTVLATILWEKIRFKKTQNLIVIPYNLYKQWYDYIRNYSEFLNFIGFIEYSDITSLYFNSNIINNYDILLTTTLYYSVICDCLISNNSTLNRVIIDEIDSVSGS